VKFELEEAVAPMGRTIIIWDDRRPGCAERKKAELAGSISPYDQVVTIGWMDEVMATSHSRRLEKLEEICTPNDWPERWHKVIGHP
jgi:hypothetical protein